MKNLFVNGKIYTMDSMRSVAEAVSVQNGLIERVGTVSDILESKEDGDMVIDLGGRTVVPGFTDTHMHLLMYGKSLKAVKLYDCTSEQDVIDRAKAFIAENGVKSGQWLVGAGWNHELFKSKKMIDRHVLDEISTEIPIAFNRVCFHLCACNSKALEIAGITADTEVDGGEVEVKNGEPTGILKENAVSILDDYTWVMSRDEKKDNIESAMKMLSSFGVTGVHTDDFDGDWQEIMDIYRELSDEGKLDVRVYQQCRFETGDGLKEFIEAGHRRGDGNLDYRIASIKILADGSLGGRTAYMNEPYSDDATTCGIPLCSQDELNSLVSTAHEAGIPVAIHAIGDGTIDMVINAIEKAQHENPRGDMRHGIVHCQITSENALKRIRDNSIMALIQPIFVAGDSKIVESRVGMERSRYSYNWKTLLNMGVHISFGTDTPVETPNPYENIYCAVTRMDMDGKPKGGWMPEQDLSVEESVAAYTAGSAYASYEENVKGSLEPGMYADMAVLSDNIFEIDSRKIKDIKCIMTVKGGKVVYTDKTINR